jgi:hypothetical protein
VIAAIDNTFLTLLLHPKAAARPNPATGLPVPHCRLRIEALVDTLSHSGGTLLVPAPALAEALCVSAAMETYLEELQQYACIEIAPFDGRAAFELGRVIRSAMSEGDKRSAQQGSWQHIKMDRAIVAIAVAHSATIFYSDDDRQIAFAKLAGLNVKSTWDLDLPPEYAQQHLSEQGKDTWPEQKKRFKSNDSDKPPSN